MKTTIRVFEILTMTSMLVVASMTVALYADGDLGKAVLSFIQ